MTTQLITQADRALHIIDRTEKSVRYGSSEAVALCSDRIRARLDGIGAWQLVTGTVENASCKRCRRAAGLSRPEPVAVSDEDRSKWAAWTGRVYGVKG